MKKTLIIACFLSAVAFLAACGEQSAVETTDVATVKTTAFIETEAPPVEFSPLAKEHFLTPLEDFSWEREYAPEYVMLHFTSAAVLSKEDPYNLYFVRQIFVDGGASIHYLIDRDGKIYCYIPETRAAWHAGKGEFASDERLTNAMNKYSIGIEMLAIGSARDMAQYFTAKEYAKIDKSLIGYTDAQYESLSALLWDICERNGIAFDREHIIGHEEYKPQKSDPGELFDWSRIFNTASDLHFTH